MWRHRISSSCGDNNTRVRDLRRVTAIAADHADYLGADGLAEFQGVDDVRADVLLKISATNGKHAEGIPRSQVAVFEPIGET